MIYRRGLWTTSAAGGHGYRLETTYVVRYFREHNMKRDFLKITLIALIILGVIYGGHYVIDTYAWGHDVLAGIGLFIALWLLVLVGWAIVKDS